MSDRATIVTALSILAWAVLSTTVKVCAIPACWGLLPAGSGIIWFAIPGTLAVALMTILLISGKTETLFKPVIQLNPEWRKALTVSGLALLTAAGWYCRSRNHFLGDGFAFLTNVSQDFFLREHEPLDFFVHQLLFRGLRQVGFSDPQYTYWLPHVALLPAFVIVLWKLAARITDSQAARTAAFALLCAAGTVQLFFGYVESYTLLNFFLALYFFAALTWTSVEKTTLPILPSIVLLLAAAFHFAAAAMLPSLLYLWLESLNRRGNSSAAGFNSLLVLSIAAAAGIAAVLAFGGKLTVPVGEMPEAAYTLFSPVHLWDKLNFLSFSFPAFLIVAPLVVVFAPSLFRVMDRKMAFTLIAALGAVGFALAFDPMLGIRDWDIFSMTATPLSLLAGMALARTFTGKQAASLLAMLALGSFVQLGTLLWINSVEYRGVSFLLRTLPVERHREANLAQLCTLLVERKYDLTAMKFLEKVRGAYEPRAYLTMAALKLRIGQPEEAIKLLEPMQYLEMNKISKRQILQDLSIAYDMDGQPGPASLVHMQLISSEIKPNSESIKYWLKYFKLAEFRNRYRQQLNNDYPRAEVLMFYIRYYSVDFSSARLMDIYKKILNSQFSPEQWEIFIRLAVMSNHQIDKYLISQASYQHPDQAKSFSVLSSRQ